jgi:cytochrome c oxidase subunit 2
VTLAFASYQDALNPAGPYAKTIADIWWLYLAICATVWVLVIAGLVIAIRRAR